MVIVVLIAALAGSHWWTYQLGVQAEHTRLANFVNGMFDDEEIGGLRQRVEVLRLMAKYPHAFDTKDVKPYCEAALALAISIEKRTIADSRKAGDDPKADRLQREVDEARRLTALLTTGRR